MIETSDQWICFTWMSATKVFGFVYFLFLPSPFPPSLSLFLFSSFLVSPTHHLAQLTAEALARYKLQTHNGFHVHSLPTWPVTGSLLSQAVPSPSGKLPGNPHIESM